MSSKVLVMSCHDAEFGYNPATPCSAHYLNLTPSYLPPLNTNICISKDSQTSITNTLFKHTELVTKPPLALSMGINICMM